MRAQDSSDGTGDTEDGGRGLRYIFNDGAFGILSRLRAGKKIIAELAELKSEQELSKEDIELLLSEQFDRPFSTETGYDALDERIAKTKAKKESMLLVLKYPELPLHNNAAELAARQQVRKRDVSLHTMVPDGTRANDTFLSIVETCKKLGVNCYDYFLDRIRRLSAIPPLAEIITAKSTS